jgi:RNA-directed DNA polymerase
MKRHGYLFEKVCNLDNIKLAHLNARKGKIHYSEVKMIDQNPLKYAKLIRKMLIEKSYKNSEYSIMTKKTDNGKIREIYKLPYFPDRIIHHAIIQVVEPIWFKSLIRDTFSSIKSRGIHDGVKRIKKALRDKENTAYCLKMDIRKYYPSVDNNILKKIIRQKIKDKNLLWLIDEIIDSTKGIPIGNYLSQYFGNLYLSELDHFCKKEIKYYLRYADDIVIMHKDKQVLHNIRKRIEKYLNEERHLDLKQNWQVFPVEKRGIDFLGYKFFHNYVLLRKSIKQKFKKRISDIKANYDKMTDKEIVNSVMSYYGWFKYCNCKNLQNKYFDENIQFIMKHTCIENNLKNPFRKIA